MVKLEIVGHKLCEACNEVRRILDSRKVDYTYLEMNVRSERLDELMKIADDEYLERMPFLFVGNICEAEGIKPVLDKVDELIGFVPTK